MLTKAQLRVDEYMSPPREIGPGLPFLPDGALPPPEPAGKTRLIRLAAVLAMVASAVYLTWRVVFTIDLAVWFVAIPMLLLELHHAVGLGVYVFSLWDVTSPRLPPPVIATDQRVALLIPTYDESVEVLLPVISAALSIAPAHETWVLDDGNRSHVAKLAADLGAQYLGREHNIDAKAGNLNNALEHIDADIVAIVDADHVVLPGFLINTLGYFADPKVAVVQTPQDFYNVDSFEHEDRGEGRPLFNEQAVFYRMILPAKNRWDAVFWCGTGAIVRVGALDSVGGVATESVTEDIQTSIRMHKLGWRIVAHNEVLARGLAAADARAYMIQRERWARGAMQVMRSEQLLTSPELAPTQRLAYAATLIAWFDSLRSLLFILLPVAVLLTGAMPIKASILVFGPLFLATFATQFTALRLLARGYYPPILSLTFETLRMPAVVPALAELFNYRRRQRRFNVTPKGRTGRDRTRTPRLITGLIALSVGSVAWAGLTLAGLTPLHYGVPGAIYGTGLFLAANVTLLIVATRRIRDSRFAGERRASVRFPVDMTGTVDGKKVRIIDLSLTGARILWTGITLEDLTLGGPIELNVWAGDVTVRSMIVRVKQRNEGTLDLGLLFLPGQWEAVRRLSLVLFHGKGDRRVEPRSEPEWIRIAS